MVYSISFQWSPVQLFTKEDAQVRSHLTLGRGVREHFDFGLKKYRLSIYHIKKNLFQKSFVEVDMFFNLFSIASPAVT